MPVASVLLAAAPAPAQRLPAIALPEHYEITLSPDLEGERFQGEETVALRLLEATSRITLNAAEIEFGEVTITAEGRTQKAHVFVDAGREQATFTVQDRLPAGPATLHVGFTGRLNDKLRGFYLSRANNRKYAVTQLEATDARRAFPCFDEPAFKATFALTLIIDRDDTAISNGRLLSDTPGPGEERHTLRFATTPKMSTYLVAAAVGDFACLEGEADGIPIRICATPDKKALGQFALEAAGHILRFYNRYYGIRYPFEKLDVVAVPDFAAGAMENTAAIFYRESVLLADATTPTRQLRNIASYLSHEIAHQWFGNLVTMRWWDDLWLNEGFATWMQTKPLTEWKPAWKYEMDEASDTQRALESDSLLSTRPIRARVETPEEINEAFDRIAYEKGAAVLRMIEAYVGVDVFRAGVNGYLRRHAYGNATSEDLWSDLSRASAKPVDRIMSAFVDRPGFPLIRVALQCRNGASAVTLSQQPLLEEPDSGSPARWSVPVCLKAPSASGTAAPASVRCELVTTERQTLTIDGCVSWVVANAGAQGYYRASYPSSMLRLVAADAAKALTPAERLAFAGDAWAMVRSGRQEIDDYLALAERLAGDANSEVLALVARRLETIGEDLVSERDRPRYRQKIGTLYAPPARELGWTGGPDETDEQRQRRTSVIRILGRTARDPEVLRQAAAMAEQYIKDPAALDPALTDTWLTLAATAGDSRLYDRYLAKLTASAPPTEYYRYLGALAAFDDPALVARSLEYALSMLRSQDTGIFIADLLTNPASRSLAWRFVTSRWDALEQKLGTFQGIPLILAASASFCDVQAEKEVRRFFDAHPVEAAERTMRQTLETIRSCIDVKKRQQDRLTQWIHER